MSSAERSRALSRKEIARIGGQLHLSEATMVRPALTFVSRDICIPRRPWCCALTFVSRGDADCQERARGVYTHIAEAKVLKSRNREAVAAACIFIACKEMKVPRTYKGTAAWGTHSCAEVCDATSIERKTINRVRLT